MMLLSWLGFFPMIGPDCSTLFPMWKPDIIEYTGIHAQPVFIFFLAPTTLSFSHFGARVSIEQPQAKFCNTLGYHHQGEEHSHCATVWTPSQLLWPNQAIGQKFFLWIWKGNKRCARFTLQLARIRNRIADVASHSTSRESNKNDHTAGALMKTQMSSNLFPCR